MHALFIDFIKRRKWWLLMGIAASFLGALRAWNSGDIEELPDWAEYMATRWTLYFFPLMFPLIFYKEPGTGARYLRAFLGLPIQRGALATVFWLLWVFVYPALVPLGVLLATLCGLSSSHDRSTALADVGLISLVAVSVFGNGLFVLSCLGVFAQQVRLAKRKMAALPRLCFLVYAPVAAVMVWQLPVTWQQVDHLQAVAITAGLILVPVSYAGRHWLLGNGLLAQTATLPHRKEGPGWAELSSHKMTVVDPLLSPALIGLMLLFAFFFVASRGPLSGSFGIVAILPVMSGVAGAIVFPMRAYRTLPLSSMRLCALLAIFHVLYYTGALFLSAVPLLWRSDFPFTLNFSIMVLFCLGFSFLAHASTIVFRIGFVVAAFAGAFCVLVSMIVLAFALLGSGDVGLLGADKTELVLSLCGVLLVFFGILALYGAVTRSSNAYRAADRIMWQLQPWARR